MKEQTYTFCITKEKAKEIAKEANKYGWISLKVSFRLFFWLVTGRGWEVRGVPPTAEK